MIPFIVAATLLTLLAGALILWPLLRSGRPGGRGGAAAVASFRRTLQELETERAAGRIGEDAHREARAVIERQLVDALAAGPAPATGPSPALRTAIFAAAVVLVVPIALYMKLGAGDSLAEASAGAMGASGDAQGGEAKGAARPLTNEQVQKMIDRMQEALQKNPADVQGWSELARANAYLHRYPDAVRAFTRALAITPRDARLMADLADAMAMASGQRLDGEPMKLVDRALQIDPREVKALALAGTNAYDHQDYAGAVRFWERAVAAAPNDPQYAFLRTSLDEARQMAGGAGKAAPAPPAPTASSGPPAGAPAAAAAVTGGAVVKGTVSLSPSLASKVQPGQTVFVFARAEGGPRVPLAMQRHTVRDLPISFSLDDSMAMMPDFRLSKFPKVVIVARVSRSGDAMASSGDLEGSSGPVEVGATTVRVTIDHEVQK